MQGAIGNSTELGDGKLGQSVTLRHNLTSRFAAGFIRCPAGHMTHNFLACDAENACWTGDDVTFGSDDDTFDVPFNSTTSCFAPVTSFPPSLACSDGSQRVPYSLVCDHQDDCTDGSDENFCVFPPCSGDTPLRCGDSGQCYSLAASCDEVQDCVNGVDEAKENCRWLQNIKIHYVPVKPPGIVHFFRNGTVSVTPMHPSLLCPETHFPCREDKFCLPVYVRCNGINDCPAHEDEMRCENYTCPGFYRCRGARVCLHPDHVCDGVHQCPQRDDELLCGEVCPAGCTCHGHAFVCTRRFALDRFPAVRYLDVSGTDLTWAHLTNNNMLIHMRMAGCNISTLTRLSFPNLNSLDLSRNNIVEVGSRHLEALQNLRVLVLKENPMTYFFTRDVAIVNATLGRLSRLDLSGGKLHSIEVFTFSVFPNLQTLNLSNTDVDQIASGSFQGLGQLRVLDVRGCSLTSFPKAVWSALGQLQSLTADNYKLCCPQLLPPSFNPINCQAPFDEVSSCVSLLRSDLYRVFLSLFSTLALLGNLVSIVTRTLLQKPSRSAFPVFVSHLCVADFQMGVYLAIIGVADRLYQGSYLWEEVGWKGSAACKAAGFLSLFSSELSAFLVCLITLDRFLVLRFPFSTLHFTTGSAHLTCSVAWVVCAALAAVPLLPGTSHWRFYGQTGICIPLPITRVDFPGHSYAFGVMIVFNFVLFIIIAVGQASIFLAVRANTMEDAHSARKSRDVSIARRLLSVVMSDFLCWFPIGLLALLAASGMAVPGEVNVSMAIFVLPLNSSLNPFLYTLNTLLERRRTKKEARLLTWLEEENRKLTAN